MTNLALGRVLNDAHWPIAKTAYHNTINGFFNGVEKMGKKYHHPVDAGSLRHIIALGNDELDNLVEYELYLSNQCSRLSNLLKKVKSNKILFYIEGHDASGKTSTSMLLAPVLVKAGRWVSINPFRAPTTEEQRNHFLNRFKASLQSDFNGIIWERGPAGDWVYGSQNDRLIDEYIKFEDELLRNTVLVKLNLRAEKHRQAKALGRRLARLKIAQHILSLDDVNEQQNVFAMQLANRSISDSDIDSFLNFESIDARFKKFVDRSSDVSRWHNVDTTHRAASRLDVVETLIEYFS